MKRKVFIIIILIISIFIIGNVKALNYARVTNTNTTIKSGPGTGSNVATLKYFDLVPLYTTYAIEKGAGGCSTGWHLVNVNGTFGYICHNDFAKTVRTGRTNDYDLNLRNGAGTGYKIHSSVSKNKLFTIINGGKKTTGSGCSGGWYRLDYHGLTSVYVCSNYISDYNETANVVITSNQTVIRTKATTKSGSIVDRLKRGQGLTLYSSKKVTGPGCTGGWYQVSYKDTLRYVCSNYVLRTNETGVINNYDGVNVRTSASTSSDVLLTLNYLDVVALNGTTRYTGSGCTGGWYKVYIQGKNGYICSNYTSRITDTTTMREDVTTKLSPDSSSGDWVKVSKDQIVILPTTSIYTGSGCKKGWYKLHIDGRAAYVCSDLTEYGKDNKETTETPSSSESIPSSSSKTISSTKTSSGYYYTISNWTYRVNENYANVRSGAGTGYSVKDTLYLGAELEVTGTATGSGCSAGWYKIKYFNNKTGYICKSLVDKYNDITKNDSSYCKTLKNAGFPESYCPYLSYLHSKYPNWVFKAENTGVTFLNAVNGESGKNYTQISASYMPYLKSSSISEAGGWRTASDAYVAFMLDPRNYFNEKNIFAFEDLAYDKNYHTKSVVTSMVSGSYLADDPYPNYFINAGKMYNVSPVHLAARVKQEGGTDKTYKSVSGDATGSCSVTAYVCSSFINTKTNKIETTDYVNLRSSAGTSSYITTTGLDGESVSILDSGKKYSGSGCSDGWYRIKLTRSLKGIYNYYNIGAYGDDPVLRGLYTAAGCLDSNDGTPWNTREKSITYGASFIANGYINKGQNTMYYQKFNTGPNATASRYTHQYMTNILAPASEALSTYESYKSMGLLNKAYVFKIPVYNSMPSNMVTHPPIK